MNICGPYWTDFPISSKCKRPHVKGAGDSQWTKQKHTGGNNKQQKILYYATMGEGRAQLFIVSPYPFSLSLKGINAVTFCSHPSFVTCHCTFSLSQLMLNIYRISEGLIFASAGSRIISSQLGNGASQPTGGFWGGSGSLVCR